MGGPSSPGSTNSSPATRPKESEKQQGTFFLGRYRVVDEIGVGGMASVHLARMDGPGGFQKWVAIKRIHPHLVEDDQFVDMFLDEARIAAGINHANVAQVFDLGKDENTYWIAMEYLHGEPLREVMRRAEERRLRISPELAARICSDAAEGLHAAHELRGKNGQLLGLVHRDVTPHNLFLTYDGYTKVVDFGIAKVADRLSSTRAGTLKGKLAYMSPEQVRGAEVDRTTDVFALGVVLWELTTNQRLFRMDTDLDTLEKVQACVVPPPSSIVADYPIELESVVMKALAKRKQDRFQTAREFSRALQNFLMRRGAFVGSEDVAQFVQQVFADRIQKREAHLAWAAEVTSTINVDQLRGLSGGEGGGAALLNLGKEPEPQPAPGQQGSRFNAAPASGVAPIGRPSPGPASDAQMSAASLMDDDEDVPTTVATRDHIEQARPPVAAVRPAAGMATPPSPGVPAGMAVQPGIPMGRTGTPPAPYPNAPNPQAGYAPFHAAQYAPADLGPGDYSGSPSNSDLQNTLALPQQPPQPEPHRVDSAASPPPIGALQPGYGAYAPPFNGQGYAPPPPYGAPAPAAAAPPSSGFSPQVSPGAASPQAFAMPAQQVHPPQSQIETALSLPRPDPAALWMAKQDAVQVGQRRNVVVLLAVVAITALCVFGIGALVYIKTQGAQPAPATTPEASPGAAAAPNPGDGRADEAAPGASAEPAAAASAKPVASPSPKTAAASPAASAADGANADAKGNQGYLTLICVPACDDVIDGNTSLGPSPLTKVPVRPGPHRLTVRRGSEKKVITLFVAPGDTSSQRVVMQK